MQQIGIYEQLITQLVESRLNREKFYVGERSLEPAGFSLAVALFKWHFRVCRGLGCRWREPAARAN